MFQEPLKLSSWFLLLLFSFSYSMVSSAASPSATRRFALLVGKEDGGLDKMPLKYAVSDAKAVAKTLQDLGGVYPQDSQLILNPSRNEFLKRIRIFEKQLSLMKRNIRKELFFYYSGHSDESGLLLGEEKITYKELKKLIASLHTEVSILIVDSCASGTLTRTKGGVKKPAFLNHALSNLKGNIVLTSSSADEVAQESDSIQGSFFTHFLISALRGAADLSGDGHITLNEAYQYVFHQTLARTVKTSAGAQHPSYSIDLTGNGEFVITEVRNASATLTLSKSLLGRVFIHDSSGKVVVEINKTKLQPITLGLKADTYDCFLEREKTLAKSTIQLSGSRELFPESFALMDREFNVSRGSYALAANTQYSKGIISTSKTFLWNREAIMPWKMGIAGTLSALSGDNFGAIVSLSHFISNQFAVSTFVGFEYQMYVTNDRDWHRRNVYYLGLDLEFNPVQIHLANVGVLELGLLLGAKTFSKSPHMGSRVTFHFAPQFAFSGSAKFSPQDFVFEAGFVTAL